MICTSAACRDVKLSAQLLSTCGTGLAFGNWQNPALKYQFPRSLAPSAIESRTSERLGPTMLPRVGQACGLLWSSVSTTMSESLKPSRVVSRYFMQ